MSVIHSPRTEFHENSSKYFNVDDVGDGGDFSDDEDDVADEDDNERQVRKRELSVIQEETVRKRFEAKGMKMLENEPRWRESVRQQMESELTRRVREALETPPLERIQKRNDVARQQRESPDINGHLLLDLSDRERDFLKTKRWKALQAKKLSEKGEMTFLPPKNGQQIEILFRDELSRSNHDEYPGVFGLGNLSEGIKNIRDEYSVAVSRYPGAKPKVRHFYTKEGFMKALRTGTLPAGVQFLDECGTYMDKYGVVRNNDGPFWPVECVPLFATPRFKWWTHLSPEPLNYHLPATSRTIDSQVTPFKGKWRGIQVAYDSERSARDFNPHPVPEGCCPTLMFESRFECGNLRQARRVGQYEYELILKSDLYTARHTQWYYFRVTNVVPGITYKFRIVNLLKRDSLYNHGMRPLLYSENDAHEKQRGWVRAGHHIGYSRNNTNHNCPLLQRGVTYHMLEWQMEFQNSDDTYYLAHCYPYSFTDLKEDLEVLMNSEERSKVTRREVMCETRAGNSCFLLTVTNFNSKDEKRAVVITARVHPGESQASWMMKGLLEFITGPDTLAQELRNKFVFKIVPMINPDGVIVGNYRCSLAARDLNRNYRHPRRENFPTVWYLKNMVDDLAKKFEIALYCDLHGHSRKPNVFMYGNNTSSDGDHSPMGMARAFISERLFPWLMSVRSPDKFHFKSCKFQIRRCKESTGRVVMWRQMKIFNSFTLEATFSGTVLDKENCRHFNILDFMEMGKVLAQAVMDYQEVQDDQTQQTQTVLDLTKVITEQILASKGLIEPDTTLPGFSVQKGAIENDAVQVQESAEKWTGALLALLNTPRDVTRVPAATDDKEKLLDENKMSGRDLSKEEESQPVYTREDVIQILEKLSDGRNMDDCLGLLAQLDVQDAIQESDSSDSDSESEPEMKAQEPKPRKKKRRSKKQRDKDNDKKMAAEKKQSEEGRAKALSAPVPNAMTETALPTLSSNSRHGGSNSAPVYSDNSVLGQSKQATSTSEKYRASRQVGSFISKYEGRHNGGVPCFTEERSMERAAKRMAELRRKHDDDKTFYCVDDSSMQQLQQEELNQRLQEINDGTPNLSNTPNIANTLLGMNVRTGYTHADNLQELSPIPNQPLNGVNSYLMANLQSQGYHPSNNLQDQSSSDTSDDNNENINHQQHLPMTARRNPYHQLDPIEPRSHSSSSVPRYTYSSTTSFTTTGTAEIPPTSTNLSATTLNTSTLAATIFNTTPSLGSTNFPLQTPLTINSLTTSVPTALTAALATTATQPTKSQKSQTHKHRRGETKVEPITLLRHLKENRGSNGYSRLDNLAGLNNGAMKPIKGLLDTPTGGGAFVSDSTDLGSQQNGQTVGQLVNHLSRNLSGVVSPLSVPKRHTRYKNTHLRSLSRNGQSFTPTSPLMTSCIVPTNRLILPDNLTPQRVDDKTRLGGRSSTNVIRSISHTPGLQHGHGYSWE